MDPVFISTINALESRTSKRRHLSSKKPLCQAQAQAQLLPNKMSSDFGGAEPDTVGVEHMSSPPIIRFLPSTMTSRPNLAELPVEILERILDFLTPESPRNLIAPGKRASLSVESFASEPPNTFQEDSNTLSDMGQLGNFVRYPAKLSKYTLSKLTQAVQRSACKRFDQLAADRMFLRITTRFSLAGFKRLSKFVNEYPHLTPIVKQFSYMIPRFYPQGNTVPRLNPNSSPTDMDRTDGTRLEEIYHETRARRIELDGILRQRLQTNLAHRVDRQDPPDQEVRSKFHRIKQDEDQIRNTMAKAIEQRQIIDESIDVNGLLEALKKFQKLQQIRLMKTVDPVDQGWDKYLRRNTDISTHFRPSEWMDACAHAARTLAFAVQQSESEVNRFSSRFMDPRTPLVLTRDLERAVVNIAVRLKCLELQIVDDRINLDEKVLQLSELFGVVFSTAVHLEILHIGL